MQLTTYHYTNLSVGGIILGKSNDLGKQPGLTPRRSMGEVTSPAKDTLATFALTEPLPQSWINNSDFPGIWNFLKQEFFSRTHAPVLLEMNVETDDNDVFVGDWGHKITTRFPNYRDVPERFRHTTREHAEYAFMQSVIPFEEYLKKQQRGEINYSVPEVSKLTSTAPHQLKVSTQQPLLEEGLDFISNWGRNDIIQELLHGPIAEELKPWREKYEMNHGSIEFSGRRKEAF